MDNKNDIERNKQLRRIADALEKIAKNTQKPLTKVNMTPNEVVLMHDEDNR